MPGKRKRGPKGRFVKSDAKPAPKRRRKAKAKAEPETRIVRRRVNGRIIRQPVPA